MAEPLDTADRLAIHERAGTEVVVAVDIAGVCRYVSPQCAELIGRSPAELAGPRHELVHGEDREAVVDAAFAAASSGTSTVTARLRHADGSWISCVARVVALRAPGGELVQFEAAVRRAPATDRSALHDDHGLCTAALLADRLSTCQGDWQRERRAFSVIAIRIDQLERSDGHAPMDLAAKRLSGAVRRTDAVARTHRTGFTVVIRAPHEAAEAVSLRLDGALRSEVHPAAVTVAVEHAIDAGGNGALMAARATRTVGLDPTP
jgi:PAS domain S-box-containing protein